MVGIICALPREIGRLSGCRVVAAGMGAEAAYRAAHALAATEPLTALISAGYAGGLVKESRVAAVVVDTADAGLNAALPPALRGRIAHSDTMVRTPAARARLAAGTGAVAVDMESAGVARAASERGLPFAAVRVITDGADREIVLPWDRFENNAAAVLAAMRSFKGMAELLRFWYASREGTRVLTSFLADFLERWNLKAKE